MNSAKPLFVHLGPAIPLVPVSDFSKTRLTDEQWRNAWKICGPSVERNFDRRKGQHLELWQVITAAYLEGLHHGSAAALSRREKV